MTHDFKQPFRIKDTALLQLLKLEYDECEITGVTEDLHLHHVVLKSQGGDDVRRNILCVAEELHWLYHHSNDNIRRMVALFVLNHRPDIHGYLRDKLGLGARREWYYRHGIKL